MPVTLSRSGATLTGVVSVTDAEPLTQWLRDTPRPKVRLNRCTHLHTAALQALLAAGATVTAPPTDPFLARWVAPLLPAAGTPAPWSADAPPSQEDQA